MRRLLIALLVLLAGLTASAQAPAAPAPYTEVEALRVENFQLQLRLLRLETGILKADLERARPGWQWNPDTGTWAQAKQ